MAKERSVLGRGLDALIPTGVPAGSAREVLLDDIVPGQTQPRTRFDEERIRALAESIRLHGILQPLIVSAPDQHGKHTLIAGERRWQAARLAGLERVPVLERQAGPMESMEIALIENIQRQDLDPLEEAAAFDRLIREHGMTQQSVADRVGRSRPAVANTLRLLSAPAVVRQALLDGQISSNHARTLLGLPEDVPVEPVLRKVIDAGLNVRQSENLVASLRDRRPHPPGRARSTSPELAALENNLRQALGTKVSVTKGRKSGKVIIEFYSDDDLDAIIKRLL